MKIDPPEFKNLTKETCRAIDFLGRQIKKGWTPQEAFQQIKTSYGGLIHDNVIYSLQNKIGFYDKKN